MSTTQSNLILLLAGVVWGSGFIAQTTAMEHIGPLLFVGIRFCLAFLATLPLALKSYHQIKNNRKAYNELIIYVPHALGIGVIFFIGMALQQIGLLHTNVSKAGFLTGLYVVFVPIILFCFTRTQPNPWTWACVLLAITAIYFINDPSSQQLNQGDTLIIISAFFWALHVIYIGYTSSRVEMPMIIACVQFGVCGLLGILSYFLFHQFFTSEPTINWQQITYAIPELLFSGIIAGALGFSLQIIGQRNTDSSSAAILLSTEALFAAIFATLILGELLTPTSYLGCLMLFITIVLIQLLPTVKQH